jgi:hypothetical protein
MRQAPLRLSAGCLCPLSDADPADVALIHLRNHLHLGGVDMHPSPRSTESPYGSSSWFFYTNIATPALGRAGGVKHYFSNEQSGSSARK